MMQVRPSIIASSYNLANRKLYSMAVQGPLSILKKCFWGEKVSFNLLKKEKVFRCARTRTASSARRQKAERCGGRCPPFGVRGAGQASESSARGWQQQPRPQGRKVTCFPVGETINGGFRSAVSPGAERRWPAVAGLRADPQTGSAVPSLRVNKLVGAATSGLCALLFHI